MTRAPAATAALDDFFASYYRHRPVSATFIGVHDYDDRLPDLSERGVDDVRSEMAAIRKRLRALPPEPLTDAEAMDRALAEGFLEIQEWEFASPHFHRGNPCVYTGEAVFGVIALFLRDFAPTARRAVAAIARMAAVPRLLTQGRTNLVAAPRAWIERAVQECIGARAFFQSGIEALIRQHGIRDPQVHSTAAAAAAAFVEFQSYLETDLGPRGHDTYGCGGEAFALYLRRGHFLGIDAAAVRATAEEQIAASEGELASRAGALGAQDWPDALARLADRHPTADAYHGRFSELWEAAREAALAHDLLTWPDYPLDYRAQPAWARGAAPYLYFLPYRSPAPFDRQAVVDYLVPPLDPEMPPEEQARRLRAVNESVIKLNHVAHHGGIGHHVQNWYAYRAASRIGQIAAVDCALRIAMFCGGTMAEGWACYATDLMDEIGFLSPLEQCAQAHARLRQAARAFVDVNLHQGTFTLDEAAAFYQRRVGLAPGAARAEAVKNSMFPATAMMYMVGTRLIHELRRELSARRPGAFDLRRFHDDVLGYGSVPVALISSAMRTARAYV
ncbi:MAG TPA: DUF885 family protein [bacterium]|nr:DUF885 family protein [bacterium]